MDNKIRIVAVAKELNVSLYILCEILEREGYQVKNSPTTRISEEMYHILLKDFGIEVNEKESNEQVNNSDTWKEWVNSEKYKKVVMEEDEFEKLMVTDEENLISEILITNNIHNLLFVGKYNKTIGRKFGFLEDIKDYHNRKNLYYPRILERIFKVFVFSEDLISGKEYVFEASLSREKERLKERNPFLLQASVESIKIGKEISDIDRELSEKKNLKKQFAEIEKKLETLKSNYEKELDIYNKMYDEEVGIYNKKKEEIKKELDTSIEVMEVETNNKIKILNNKVKEKQKDLDAIKLEIDNQNNLFIKAKNTLSIINKLQLISSEEDHFKDLYSETPFNLENHLDFGTLFNGDFKEASIYIFKFLYFKNLYYTPFQIRNIMSLIKTHDIIILSGLSGSGKSQIIKSLADSIGGICKTIPVKPNWTSSDDLLGYFNPLTKTFTPTPFTETIVEALFNPNQIYFVCLDEMNLARVEYYFTEFISCLEDKSSEPTVQLYSKSEKDSFLTEVEEMIKNILVGSKLDKYSLREIANNEKLTIQLIKLLDSCSYKSSPDYIEIKKRFKNFLLFPPELKIPQNIRFIGTINVDETTHYFSPKIIDRIHLLKFESNLNKELEIIEYNFETHPNYSHMETNKEKDIFSDVYERPLYIHPKYFLKRNELVAFDVYRCSENEIKILKKLNDYLKKLNVEFGHRTLNQSIIYMYINFKYYSINPNISLNEIINQKILPRLVLDGEEVSKEGISNLEQLRIVGDFIQKSLKNGEGVALNELEYGVQANTYISDMIKYAENNNSQINFYS